MSFATPWALLALIIIPFLIWRLTTRHSGGAVRYSEIRRIPAGPARFRPAIAALVPWLQLAGLICLIIALARPQGQAAAQKETTEGIDIMLTMDISGSMRAEDFRPKNRFTVAQDTLERFAMETSNDRVGLVVFASRAFTQCPLTLDNEMVAALVRQVQQGMIEDGTAIGMAIATAAHRLKQSEAKSRVIILMTDGVNNTGKIDPITAARAAAALGLRIYCVGVGKEGGAPIPVDDGVFGRQYARNPDGTLQMTEIDEKTLQQIAKIGNGKYFRVTDAAAMAQVYEDIRKLEKSKFELKTRRPVIERFSRFLIPGVLLLLLAFLLDNTTARRTP